MFIEYIQAAMGRARYELLENNEGFYAEIPRFKGLWANADTLEGCREELLSTLQDWILIKLRHHDTDLPVIQGMNLNMPVVTKRPRQRRPARARRKVA